LDHEGPSRKGKKGKIFPGLREVWGPHAVAQKYKVQQNAPYRGKIIYIDLKTAENKSVWRKQRDFHKPTESADR